MWNGARHPSVGACRGIYFCLRAHSGNTQWRIEEPDTIVPSTAPTTTSLTYFKPPPIQSPRSDDSHLLLRSSPRERERDAFTDVCSSGGLFFPRLDWETEHSPSSPQFVCRENKLPLKLAATERTPSARSVTCRWAREGLIIQLKCRVS